MVHGIREQQAGKRHSRAQLTTTAIYADAVGAEEKDIARACGDENSQSQVCAAEKRSILNLISV